MAEPSAQRIEMRSAYSSIFSATKALICVPVAPLILYDQLDGAGRTAVIVITVVLTLAAMIRAARVWLAVDGCTFEARNYWTTYAVEWTDIEEVLAVDAGLFFGSSIGVRRKNDGKICEANASIMGGSTAERQRLYEYLQPLAAHHGARFNLRLYDNGNWAFRDGS